MYTPIDCTITRRFFVNKYWFCILKGINNRRCGCSAGGLDFLFRDAARARGEGVFTGERGGGAAVLRSDICRLLVVNSALGGSRSSSNLLQFPLWGQYSCYCHQRGNWRRFELDREPP